METHNEFMERVVEESREPTLAEETHDALKHDANYNKNEVKNGR